MVCMARDRRLPPQGGLPPADGVGGAGVEIADENESSRAGNADEFSETIGGVTDGEGADGQVGAGVGQGELGEVGENGGLGGAVEHLAAGIDGD